jgi:hypothetical protein
MTDTHVTNGAGTPEAVTSERMVTWPKRDRAEYMRDYRARQSHKSENPELNNGSRPDNNFKSEIIPDIPPPPAPQLNSAPPAPEQKTEAEKYESETVSQADEAALALKRQIEELRKSEQLNRQYQEQQNRQQQEQENYLRHLRQTFQYWKQNGLTNEQEQFLLAGPPTVIDELTRFAAQQAVSQGHQAGSAEHEQAAQKVFREHLERLREQAAAAQQPTEPTPTAGNQTEPAMTEPTTRFFQPPPAKPMRPPSVPVSAPVSRTVPDGSQRPQFEENPSRVVLSADEKLLAKGCGLSEVEWARQKVRVMQAKARGEIV